MARRNPRTQRIDLSELGQLDAVYSECAPTLSPGPAVVLGVEAVTSDGQPVVLQIAFPASGVQSLRRDLRQALEALPLEHRQENN